MNMKTLMTDTDFWTPEEVKEVVQNDNTAYKSVSEKTLCRLYTFGEGLEKKSNLWMLPKCIDKWRKFVKERKALKFWFRYFEKKPI